MQSNLLPLQVTVLRVHNLPRLKTLLGKKRRFYATVTDGEKLWHTRSVRSVGQRVEWNENVAFVIQPLSHITVSMYAKMTMRKDVLVGTQEVVGEPRGELDVVFDSNDTRDGHPTEPTMFFLMISVSPNAASPSNAVVETPNLATTDQDRSVAQGGAPGLTVPFHNETMQSTAFATTIYRKCDPPTESDDPVRSAPDSQAETSRSALRRAEESISTIKMWKRAASVIKLVMDAVGPIAVLNPYASLAWSLLSKIPENLLKQVERDCNVETLLEAIRDAFEFAEEADTLRNIKPESKQAAILEEMLECVTECAKFIRSYAEDVQVGKRALKNILGQADGKIEEYRSNLVRLRESFLAHAAVTTEITVLEAELNARIRELPYKGGWRFGADKRCLPGTREDFLDHIVMWVENPKSKRGLVLLGQAGTGKSSIAHEVARRFDKTCLGSYFAFLRKEQSKDEAYQLFTTLARDLSDRHPAFKIALGRAIKNNSSLRGTRDYHTLFESLLIEPLKNLPLPGPILIVIDALDESGDATGKKGLHAFLAEHLIDLPFEFRILITSRCEGGIEPAFAEASSVDTLYMDDAKLAAKTEQDIGIYLETEIPPDVFKDYGVKLAKAAEGLFQWAAVACGFINSPPASFGFSKRKCVQRLLGHSRDGNTQDPLDKLYVELLEGYFKPHEAQILFQSVMGQLFAAIEPLSIESLIILRRRAPCDDPEDSDPVLEMLRHLGSLLSNVTSSDQTRPIVPLHTSFRDFLTNKKSGVFYVDLEESHRELAHSCLGLMLEKLEFNICKFESSYLANSDVPDLESRISKHISPALLYACVFWDDHLEHLPFEHDLFTKLRSLFEAKYLFWLEILSIKNVVGLASPALSSLKTWLRSDQRKSHQASPMEVENLFALVNDASSFVRYFGMAIARSAPHIYISALPFAPTSSHIHEQYIHLFPHTLCFERGQLSHWPALEMVILAHDEAVRSVAFAPDGLRIASASDDFTIRVWDATTGEMVAGPFTGHTSHVKCVSFSPDGKRIASSSNDSTIRVWDAASGEVIAGPFMGHTGRVPSVQFSPNGQFIASASGDCTILVWVASTGETVASLTGHASLIYSVAFSPDSKRIASASADRTIRVWDVATRQVAAGPFTGHTDEVRSISFSPDGQRIASASEDRTIRVWNAATGEVVAGPFFGHTDIVCSVAFSPDGLSIASASFDTTIRVWNAETGDTVAGPFTDHTASVQSVAFSPDGQRIASASDDQTIRTWAVAAGGVSGPFTGHTSAILCIALSPDGRRIASASLDRIIYIWDATTGAVVTGPVTGHADQVNSVAFSPDGQLLASGSGDHTVRTWDATTGAVASGPFTGHTDQVASVEFSPDGKCIASASMDHTIRVWDATSGEVTLGPLTGHSDSVICAAFSPEGRRIASASFDCTIRVWDATTGEVIAGPFTHSDPVFSIAFSPEGQSIVSGCFDHKIRVWDAATEEMIAGPFTGHTEWISSVAFSSDGRRIASASFDRTICVWDAATGEMVVGPFTGHTDVVISIEFSPDGQHIASGSGDSTIRMWDVRPGTGAIQAGVNSASSGQRITSASRDHAVCLERARAEDIESNRFMNEFLINDDGWMCVEERELLLWVPRVHRPYCHRSNTVWIAGKHETWLDMTKFVHGSSWATVYVHNADK